MLSKLSLTKILNTWTINSLFTKYRYTYYIYNYIYIFIHTHFQNIANAKYIFNIYIFSLIKKLINDACKFHIKGTTSFCYHLRVVGHTNTPAFAWCCQSHEPEILQNKIFWTFICFFGVIHHPNYYFLSLLSHVGRKCLACELKAAISWLHF